MRLLDLILTPRGAKHASNSQAPLALPWHPDEPAAPSPRREASVATTPSRVRPLRLGKLMSAASRLLTPRGRRKEGDATAGHSSACSTPRTDAGDSQRIKAYTPTLTALMEQQLRLSHSPAAATASGSARRQHPTPPPVSNDDNHSSSGARSDSESDAGSDVSSLDGFGDYARNLTPRGGSEGGEGTPPSCASTPTDPDTLPSPRLLMAPVQQCSTGLTARDNQRGADDLELFLQSGELPGSRSRLVRLLLHADGVGDKAFAGLALHELGYERCVALLLHLLLPLPLNARSAALTYLQAKLCTHLVTFLGGQLERVLESERACQRFCRLPFECAAWLLETGPSDRGETLFDLANLWLEHQPRGQRQQQRPELLEEQQRALAELVWRRPLAQDFLRCMAANLPWAADYVAPSGQRPAKQPQSLDGQFSFTADFDLHDVLELQQAAMGEGRPRQQQSPAIYCGGYCWWAVLVANPRHGRFDLYASCSPFSLFQEPARASLQPPADVRFSFQGTTALADWQQTNGERLAAMHTHWGGPAFYAPVGSRSLLAGASSRGGGSSSSRKHQAATAAPMAAAARPDTARGQRPSRQISRLRIAGSAAKAGPGDSPGQLASSRSLASAAAAGTATPRAAAAATGATPPLPSSSGGSGSSHLGYSSGSDGGFNGGGGLTGRQLALAEVAPAGADLQQLTMDQLVAEVRRSCPYSWGASLRIRVQLKLLGSQ